MESTSMISGLLNFNPRSLAGATYASEIVTDPEHILIHAPLRERHAYALQYIRLALDFNPRSLAGATMFTFALSPLKLFQSTLPCGSDI